MLLKRHRFIASNWKYRWFVLHNLTLVYYATENDGKQPPPASSPPRKSMVLTGVEYDVDDPLGLKVSRASVSVVVWTVP